MDNQLRKRDKSRKRRVFRVRTTLKGTKLKPRMSVFKSNNHVYVQLIDDEKGETLAGIGTMAKELKEKKLGKKSKEAARYLGTKIAEFAKDQQIKHVVFDRGRFKFHGILAELANAAREAGLQF